MPAISKASSTPLAALAVPMAPMLGVQVFASTLAAETVCARRLHVGEELRDHLVAEEVEPDQAGAQPDRKEEHETDNDAPFHRLFPRFRTHINGFI